MPNLTRAQRIAVDALREQGLKMCPHPLCPSEGTPQPLSAFYPKKGRRDGLSGWCRACWARERADAAKRYRTSDIGVEKAKVARQQRRADGREKKARARYNATEKGRATTLAYVRSEHVKEYRREYRRRHAQKLQARNAVNNAVGDGMIPMARTQLCESCGQFAIAYHHHLGYAPEHWLDIVPLCGPCHSATHRHSGASPTSAPTVQSGQSVD